MHTSDRHIEFAGEFHPVQPGFNVRVGVICHLSPKSVSNKTSQRGEGLSECEVFGRHWNLAMCEGVYIARAICVFRGRPWKDCGAEKGGGERRGGQRKRGATEDAV